MSRAKGRRYEQERKLNMKKVIAVIVAIAVIIMFIIGIKTLLTTKIDEKVTTITSYYPLYTNEKWGVIDETGKIVIEPKYEEMITIPSAKDDIFIIVHDTDYSTGAYKTEVLDKSGNKLFTNYDVVEAIENSDIANNLWYEEGVLKVTKDSKVGLIDFNGKEILPLEYDKIESLQGTKNSLIIKKGENVGLCDLKGEIIINPIYKEIKSLDNDYKKGYIVVNKDNKYGVIDFTKQVILEEKYDDIKQTTSNGLYIVKEDSILKVVDKNEVVLEDKFSDATAINGENITYKEDEKYGIIDTKGEIKIDADYEDLQYAFNEYYIAKKDGKFGVINTSKEEILPFEYESIIYEEEANIVQAQKENMQSSEIYDNNFNKKLEGTIIQINSEKAYIKVRVQDEYKYYNFKFEEKKSSEILTENTIFLSKKDGKYGFIDNRGNIVVDYIYDDATEQNSHGYASIKKDGKWGVIDSSGKVIVEPKYDLENNFIIDFINKWHIGEDLNSYYYTDI